MRFKPAILLILIGFLTLSIGIWRYQSEGKNLPLKQTDLVEQTEKRIQDVFKRIAENKNKLFKSSNTEFRVWCESNQLEGIRFRRGIPEVWTSSRYQIDIQGDNQFNIIEQNGLYIGVWNISNDSLDVALAENLFNTQFPPVDRAKFWEKSLDLFLGKAPLEGSSPMVFQTEMDGPAITDKLYLLLFDYQQFWIPDGLVFIGIILLCLGIYFFGLELHTRKYAILNAALWIIYVISLNQGILGEGLRHSTLFNSNVFQFNVIYNSLGEALMWAGVGLWFIRFLIFQSQLRVKEGDKFLKVFLANIFGIGAYVLFYYSWRLSEYFVEHTEIHFRFTELLLISWESVLSISLIALQLVAAFSLLHGILKLNQQPKIKGQLPFFFPIHWFGLSVAASIAGCPLHYITLTAIVGIFFTIPFMWETNRVRTIRWFTEVILPCFLLGFVFSKTLEKVEFKERKLFASTLMVEPDNEIKALLLDAEKALLRDLPILYKSGIRGEKGDALEATIKQQYFPDLLDEYSVSLFGYNANGEFLNADKQVEYGTLNSMYLGEAGNKVTLQFFLMNERRLSGTYMGKFPIYNDSSIEATYFVMLSPTGEALNGRLSDVLTNSKEKDLLHRNNYSYAIYSGNRLSKHFGEYDYNRIYNWPTKLQGDYSYTEPEYHHNITEDAYGNLVVVTKPKQSWLVSSIQFTLMVLFGLLLAVLLNSFMWLEGRWKLKVNPKYWQRIHSSDNNLLFSSSFQRETWFISRRLQVYIIWLLVLIFGLVLYFTVNYFTINNAKKQEQKLLNTTNQIANRISGQSNLNALVNQNQVGLIYNLAESFQTDINIYDEKGYLIVSTNPRLYNERFRSKYMNPIMYNQLTKGESSSVIGEERISDLTYISAYTIITDNDLEVRGFLNLPYFSNRVDLYRDISDYTVTILNLFILVFLLVFLVTAIISKRITQPLLHIRDELSHMKLGEKHEPIAWYRNDEIGLLVREYNKMIDALDDSVNKLSEVERQGAWREMAKQVAHEIKNPLTPMRLSLQHLEYSIQRNDDNIKEKITKTIQLLIRQIDSLSTMAEEFSSFAKMPEPKIEVIDFKLVLTDAKLLMEREMGQQITMDLPDSEIWINADPHQLGRVFNNLFKNALQAIPDNRVAQVKVLAEIKDAKVVIQVVDNGKGIPEELYKKIFSPNFSTKNSGMGLGLAISKKIVNQFGGTITFNSTMDVGTTFTLSFPLLK